MIAPGRQRDFTEGDTIVTDTTALSGLRHGTNCMGLVAGNKLGTYVGSGFGAQFALARTEVDATETPVEMLYWGMGAEWADSLGADVITSSLGYFTFDNSADDYTYADMDGHTTDVTRAAEIAASKGILVCNAVGNEGGTSWHYLIAPADVFTDSLIAVGAVDAAGTVAGFSSYGPSAAGCFKPDISARGVTDTLVSTGGNPNLYTTGSGTIVLDSAGRGARRQPDPGTAPVDADAAGARAARDRFARQQSGQPRRLGNPRRARGAPTLSRRSECASAFAQSRPSPCSAPIPRAREGRSGSSLRPGRTMFPAPRSRCGWSISRGARSASSTPGVRPAFARCP